VPDAWIDESKTEIGYDIAFTRYFYQYEPLRPTDEIARDIEKLEKETSELINEIL
jgi:type I restriction enzyme M protein